MHFEIHPVRKHIFLYCQNVASNPVTSWRIILLLTSIVYCVLCHPFCMYAISNVCIYPLSKVRPFLRTSLLYMKNKNTHIKVYRRLKYVYFKFWYEQNLIEKEQDSLDSHNSIFHCRSLGDSSDEM